MLTIRLLGGASIEGPEGPLTGRVAQRARLGVLAVLAIAHPRSVRRDRLLATLWPESDTDRARHLLRDSVYRLREALGDDALVAAADEIRLDAAHVRCDLWEFEDALARGDLASAIEGYAGPFLDGFFLDGSAEFERWADGERQRLAALHGQALGALAARRSECGDWTGAVELLRRLAIADPYDARVAIRLMEALSASGDRVGALRHADAHAALLRADFGAEPDPGVVALADRLRRGPMRDVSDVPIQPGGVVSLPSAKTPPHAARATNGRRFRVVMMGAVAACTLLVAVAMRWTRIDLIGLGPERPYRLLVTDFGSTPGDSMLTRLAAEIVRMNLQQSEIVSVQSPEGIAAALRRMRRDPTERVTLSIAREIGLRDRIPIIVDGDLLRSGRGFVLLVRVVRADSGKILATESVTAATPAALIAAAEKTAQMLRSRLGETMRDVRATPGLAAVTTASFPALQKFTEAQRVLGRERNYDKAIALFKEAVAIDSTFAMAWRLLYITYGNARLGTNEERDEAIARAFRHRDRLTEVERLHTEGTYYIARDRAKSIGAYERLVGVDSTRGLVNLAQSLLTRRQFARAETLQRAAALRHNKNAWLAHANLVDMLMNQGKRREADSVVRSVGERFPQIELGRYLSGVIACVNDGIDGCWAGLDSLRASSNGDTRFRVTQLLSHLMLRQGAIAAADRLDAEWRQLQIARGAADDQISRTLRAAQIELLVAQRPESALSRVRGLGPPSTAADARTLAIILAGAGKPERARSTLAEYERSHPDRARTAWDRSYLIEGWAEVALAEGRWADAITGFRAADLLPDGPRDTCSACLPLALARVYDRAGQPDSAIVMYERFLMEPYFPRFELDSYHLGQVHERLAMLYRARGDTAKAAANDASLVALWGRADAVLQPRVARARARATRILSNRPQG
jgi:DNA-binding SARP family transcriptional activator